VARGNQITVLKSIAHHPNESEERDEPSSSGDGGKQTKAGKIGFARSPRPLMIQSAEILKAEKAACRPLRV
jgi:hypothetical protein